MADAYFSNVVLLVGNDNAADTTTTFTDQSNGGHSSPTVGGNVQYDSAQAPTGMTTSIYCDGTGDGLSYASHADFGFGTGDFTIEGFVRFQGTGTNDAVFDLRTAEPSVKILIYTYTDDSVNVWVNSGAMFGTGASGYTSGTWYHWAISRVGIVARLYWNGTLQSPLDYNDHDFGASAPLVIGKAFDGTQDFQGWIGPTRITKGVGRYTADPTITVPSLPFELGASTAPTLSSPTMVNITTTTATPRVTVTF
jgi:hypothetical protein